MAEEDTTQVGFTDTTDTTAVADTTQAQTTTTTDTTAKTDEPKKYWDDEYKVHFGDEPVEKIKEYKTLATDLSTKEKEYQLKLEDYEKKTKDLTEKRFANERIAKLNELAESGVEVDENFVAFLNKDYNKITDPIQGLADAMKKENPSWSDKKIKFELETKYKLDQIAGIDEEDMTDRQKEIRDIIQEDLTRDWDNKKKELLAEQETKRLVKKPSAEDLEKESRAVKEKEIADANLAKQWKERVEKTSKENNDIKFEFPKELGIKINDKEVELPAFEYKLTKDEKAQVDKAFENVGNFWAEITKDAKSVEEADKIVYNIIASVLTGKNASSKLAAAQWQSALETLVKSDKKSTPIPQGGGGGSNYSGEGFK